MDLFVSLQIFRKVAEQRSFKQAADHFRMSSTAITKHVQALEDRVGARLLDRTTRRVGLTAAGEEYLRRCIGILEELAEAEAAASQTHVQPKGTLRVGAPIGLGVVHLSEAIVRFLRKYPEMKVDLQLSDLLLDADSEGYDLTVRIDRELPNSSQIVLKLGKVRRVLVAHPSYLAKAGVPRHPDDLQDHNSLIFSYNPNPDYWTFEKGDRSWQAQVAGSFRSNNSFVLKRALMQGVGICLIPSFYVTKEIQAGQLKVLLKDYEPDPYHLFLLHSGSRTPSGKVRAFMEFLKEEYAGKLI
jgi:DNA-binding transcriptional LysR family regulator